MRHHFVTHEGRLEASREQWDDGRRPGMISDETNLAEAGARSCRERHESTADCLLSLAAAPTFAIMAALTAVDGGGMPDMLCAAAHAASPLSGMVPMYVLMSAFHLAPWLRLISPRQAVARQSSPTGLHDLR
jgi:hypothetical protein